MHRVLKKDQIFTIPNLLSLLRLLMIPLIVWLYCVKQEYVWATVMILVSGLTDVVDGIIARKWGMVSDFGKILDPIADKCTQGAIILCLTVRHWLMWLLITLFVVKEICMAAMGFLVLRRKDSVNSAKWHGKVNTVVLYAVLMLLILFPAMPTLFSNSLIVLCCGLCLLSFVLYAIFYFRLLFDEKK